MKNGTEEYDQQVLNILEKKYHMFLDSPKGEIQMYLVLPPKNEFDDNLCKDKEIEKNSFTSKNILNMDNDLNSIMEKDSFLNYEKLKLENNKPTRLSNSTNYLNQINNND